VTNQADINDAKVSDEKSESLRTCIASGAQRPKADMVRFVIGPDDRPVPDLEEKLPGRGLWLSAERHVIHTACAKNLFARRARCRVQIDADMPAALEGLMARRCIRWLELARRAGQAVGGFDEVRRGLAHGGGGIVLSARDGATGSRDKIARIAQGLAILDALGAVEIGAAFGRERVVHALVSAGGLAENLLRDMTRLSGLREQEMAA
jgi:uncharacterized protein